MHFNRRKFDWRDLNMSLHFKMTISESDDPILLVKWIKKSHFPDTFTLTELDILSIIRMSRTRNKTLHERMKRWYGDIEPRFRLI